VFSRPSKKSAPRNSAMWHQFRRLILGTVVEYLLDHKVQIVFETISITFHSESDFRVPRLNNYMRFKGDLQAKLLSEMTPTKVLELERGVRETWPELLKVVDIPIGDRLTSEKNHVKVSETGASDDRRLLIEFDLIAD